MNLKIGTEATQFPEKEYINGIFVSNANVGAIYCYNIKSSFQINPFTSQHRKKDSVG
jgi:hypothetical protein